MARRWDRCLPLKWRRSSRTRADAPDGQRLTADASNVMMLVVFAYDVKNFQITGTARLATDSESSWNIVANSEPQFYISVFRAVEEQLGLRLEARTAPVEMMVVDRVEKPSGN
jgi:hypothetical protein